MTQTEAQQTTWWQHLPFIQKLEWKSLSYLNRPTVHRILPFKELKKSWRRATGCGHSLFYLKSQFRGQFYLLVFTISTCVVKESRLRATVATNLLHFNVFNQRRPDENICSITATWQKLRDAHFVEGNHQISCIPATILLLHWLLSSSLLLFIDRPASCHWPVTITCVTCNINVHHMDTNKWHV